MRASFPVKARGCFGTQATCPAVSAAGAKRFLQRRQPNRHHCKRWERRATTGEGEVSIADVEDLEAQMEDFLKKQAAKESGLVAAVELPKTPIGTETVSDEEAKEFCRQVVRMVKVLREKRDMSVNEVKLTIAIEPPSEREQREYMGIENERGVSRDEMAAALLEVAAGRVPRDRIALRELYKEMSSWPFLEEGAPAPAPDEGASPYEEITDTGAAGWRRTQARPKMMARDKNEKPQGLVDMLPDWMGYGVLYLISAIPVLIAGTVIAILFFNSLR